MSSHGCNGATAASAVGGPKCRSCLTVQLQSRQQHAPGRAKLTLSKSLPGLSVIWVQPETGRHLLGTFGWHWIQAEAAVGIPHR